MALVVPRHHSLPSFWDGQVHNEGGKFRVVVTKDLPGDRWLQILTQGGCRVEVSKHHDTILSNATIKKLIGSKCDGVIGQLTEVGGWGLAHGQFRSICHHAVPKGN